MRRYFKVLAGAICGLWLTAASASAEQVMFEYYALLSTQDTYNSRGAPLNDVCAIVQQDRANVHKFGKRDPSDNVDTFFTTPQRRAMMTGKCDYNPSYHTVERIRSQFIGFVRVVVFGAGGRVSRVAIYEAAG